MKKILIVDDNIEFAKFVSEVCSRMDGIEPLTCYSVEEARKAVLNNDNIVLAVLDIVMPEEDVFELISWLKENSYKIPNILVSGYNPYYSELAEKMSNLYGMESKAILREPVRLAELQETIAKALSEF